MQPLYLEIISGSEPGRTYVLAAGANSIGRDPGNNVILPAADKSVSGHHAIIYVHESRTVIQDLSSTNGTFVNDEQTGTADLNPDDAIGLGRAGPRLRLCRGEPGTPSPAGPPSEAQPLAAAPTERPVPGTTTRDRPARDSNFIAPQGSQTSEMEHLLVEKRMDGAGMQRLLKDTKRVEKILNRGALGDTGTHMLMAAYQAGRKVHRQWVAIVSSIVAVAAVVVVALAIRAARYQRLLEQGLSLEETLDRYEAMIAEYNDDPEANRATLDSLIARLDSTRTRLSSVKGELRTDDIPRFYADTVEMLTDRIMRRFGETDYHIPPTMIARIKHHLSVFSGPLKKTVARYIERKKTYAPMILSELRRKRLPPELAYVAMLESGYNPRALSHAGARGMWQFMPATARRYGLRVGKGVDERLDPEKSTRAAAEYFEDLIGIFGGKRSVMLAMAAYNAGEARVMNALRKVDDPMRNRDFWYIYRLGILAEETNEYIPRILALMIISENPEHFGFPSAAQDEETVPVSRP